ncbi:hypothetical protein [Shewanella maritima]
MSWSVKKMLNQGDLCPHCSLIITLPPNLQPNCLGCGKPLTQQEEDDE